MRPGGAVSPRLSSLWRYLNNGSLGWWEVKVCDVMQCVSVSGGRRWGLGCALYMMVHWCRHRHSPKTVGQLAWRWRQDNFPLSFCQQNVDTQSCLGSDPAKLCSKSPWWLSSSANHAYVSSNHAYKIQLVPVGLQVCTLIKNKAEAGYAEAHFHGVDHLECNLDILLHWRLLFCWVKGGKGDAVKADDHDDETFEKFVACD